MHTALIVMLAAVKLIQVPDEVLSGVPTCAGPYPRCPVQEPASCRDHERDAALNEAAQRGDIALLLYHYATASSLKEKYGIVEVLLKFLPENPVVWNVLSPLADDAVRFSGSDERTQMEFLAYCSEHRLYPLEYSILTFHTFVGISKDPRSRDLLRRALTSDDADIAAAAVAGLAAVSEKD